MTCDPGMISKVQRKASFKGASFHVDSSSESYGRRIVTHEFPLLDTPYNEDMGGKAVTVSIEGYLTGNGWLSDRDALISACASYGSGILVHPFYDYPIMAACTDITVSETKDELGRINVSLKFTEDTAPVGVSFSIGFLTISMGTAVDALVSSAMDTFELSLNKSGGDRVFDSSADMLRAGTVLVDEARLLSVVDSSLAPKLKRTIDQLFGGWDIVVRGGRSAWRDNIKTILSAFRNGVADKKSLARVMSAIANLDRGFVPATSGAGTRIAADKARVEAAKMMRRIFGSVMGEAAAMATYNSRSEAAVAKNRFALWYQDEAAAFNPLYEHDSMTPLDAVRSRVIDVFDKSQVDATSTIKITLPGSTNAMALAQRLYGDPSRFEDVWIASNSSHPSFISGEIEVRAR